MRSRSRPRPSATPGFFSRICVWCCAGWMRWCCLSRYSTACLPGSIVMPPGRTLGVPARFRQSETAAQSETAERRARARHPAVSWPIARDYATS